MVHAAAIDGDNACLEMLLGIDGVDIHLRDGKKHGKTPLHVAAENGHQRTVELLLQVRFIHIGFDIQ